MPDYRTVGAHQLNRWLWSRLSTLTYFDFQTQTELPVFDAYGPGKIDLVPIIPSQQQPELTNISGGAPFMVYSYTMSTPGTEWWMNMEQAVYVIYDNDEERLRAIHTYMVNLFKRYDETAKSINNFLGISPFDFKWVGLSTATGPDPAISEGGRQGAMVAIRYEYSHDLVGDVSSPNLGLRP